MSSLRRVLILLTSLWILVSTNPGSIGSKSFRRFINELTEAQTTTEIPCHHGTRQTVCIQSRRAYPELNHLLESFLAPHRSTNSLYFSQTNLQLESIDYALFTLIRPISPSDSSSSYAFIGILGLWLPFPDSTRLTGSVDLTHLTRFLRRQVQIARKITFSNRFSYVREQTLPRRPWEWLIAYFTIVGAVWLMFPEKAQRHFTLTWKNIRHYGNWWCMVLFHLSHGGSLLRLFRTIVSVNYLAPILVSRRIITLSGLYGVVLTSSATSTALGMLVLARRYLFRSRSRDEAISRAPLEINGGGGCVYALLVAACLSPASQTPFPGGARPFDLLMLNVLFDSFFLAGQQRIADYTAHTGAALGSWLFCSINMYS